MAVQLVVLKNGNLSMIPLDGIQAQPYDISPAEGSAFADRLTTQIDTDSDFVFETCQALQGRAFRYAGDRQTAIALRDDLRSAVEFADKIAADRAAGPANDA